MKLLYTYIIVFLTSSYVFSQDNLKKHTVTKGETITSIAKKYNVSVQDILNLNPNSNQILSLDTVILIPNVVENKSVNNTISLNRDKIIQHIVMPKETVYGIAKKYNISIELLNNTNEDLVKNGLKIDQVLQIPISNTGKSTNSVAENQLQKSNTIQPKEEVSSNTTMLYEVLTNDTEYSIAKNNKISINELRSINPELLEIGLKIGQKIKLPINQSQKVVNQDDISNAKDDGLLYHEVLAKETKYGIAKKYAISIENLEALNPEIVNSFPVGYKLVIGKKPVNVDKKIHSESVVVTNNLEHANHYGSNDIVRSYNNCDLADQLVEVATSRIGTRYRPGGTTEEGFDCSGLVFSTFENVGIKLPRSSVEQANYGVKIGNEQAQKGDLIFFKTNRKGQINHVGMVVDVVDGEIKFIHSSNTGVIISSTKESYYEKNLVQVNRVL